MIKHTVALLVAILMPFVAFATSEVVRDPKSWDFAPLLYSHRIVRGTIVSTTRVEVPFADLHPEFSDQLKGYATPILHVEIDVHEVLRGPDVTEGEDHVIIVEDLSAVYPIGHEMLVCEYHHTALDMYYQGGVYGRYSRKGKNWVSEDTVRGRRSFSDADMRAKIASMDIDHVALEADLVVDGTIESVAISEYAGPDGSTAELITLNLRVGSVEKGEFSDSTIVVKALGEGMYLPEWRKHVPRGYEAGQRWLCFLGKRDELGWYPFAGSNGLFRYEGGVLIYDDRVPFWHSLDEVKSAVARSRGQSR